MKCPRCHGPTLAVSDSPDRYCHACGQIVAGTAGRAVRGTSRGGGGKSEAARTLHLPYPLSTNNLFTTWKDGTRHKSEAAKAYREEAGQIARLAFAEPIQGQVAVHIVYTPKRGVGLDIDNCAKCALDSLKGIAWNDDRQIWRLVIERRPCVVGGAFTVEIQEIEA